MPPTTASDKAKEEHGVSQNPISRRATKVQNFFSIPAPVKALFDRVPVLVYPPNELPQRAPKPSRIPSLYVFSSIADAAAGKPSFNPSCLKWQAFLNIAGVNHRLVASSNHASPTGVLPFLLPAASTSSTSPESLPVPSNKLVEYVEDHGAQVEEPANLRYEAYRSLLDYRIRNAWLYTLYLEPLNFSAVAYPLYVSSTTTNPLVRASISHQLISAAEAELLKNSSIIDIDDLYSEADKAFEALSILLGDDPWFFGSDEPTLYDASVFGYTQLLLDDGMGWEEKKLCRALRRRTNLVQHRERLLVRYFGGMTGDERDFPSPPLWTKRSRPAFNQPMADTSIQVSSKAIPRTFKPNRSESKNSSHCWVAQLSGSIDSVDDDSHGSHLHVRPEKRV